MASVIINNVTYQNVPKVSIPKSGGGTADFLDTSDAPVDNNNKVLYPYTCYSNGVKYTGSLTTVTVSQDATTKVLSIS